MYEMKKVNHWGARERENSWLKSDVFPAPELVGFTSMKIGGAILQQHAFADVKGFSNLLRVVALSRVSSTLVTPCSAIQH